MPKVAVLVGGPDWPTAVLCSMLKVPVISMLIGISPVLVLIVPVVMSSSFMLLSAEASTEEAASRFRTMSTVLLMVGGVVQMGSLVVAGWFLEAVMHEHKDELEEVREKDKPVIEAVAKAEMEMKRYKEQTAWEVTPLRHRLNLFLGSLSACAMLHIFMEYFCEPFRKFSLIDKIWCNPRDGSACHCDLPDCNPLKIINMPGWIALFFLCFSILCQWSYKSWCRQAVAQDSLTSME